MTVTSIGVAVIGGGPAGIAAATAASSDGATVLLIEQDKRLGGRLKQAIHDGFGYIRFEDALTGPEYIYRELSQLHQTKAVVLLQTTVVDITKFGDTFQLTLSSRHGITVVEARAVVITTGCRERTFSELNLFGTRPAGVYTAGTVQYYLNIMGQLPARQCIMLGSDNLALLAARRLKLNGVNILGVYEPDSRPKGYLSNVTRCLFDYDIPLFTEHTVTRVHGTERIQAVTLARADKSGQPIRGSEKAILCDTLVVSQGLLPINQMAVSLGVPISEKTHGPMCDQNFMTLSDGVFCAGGSLFISDLVDFLSESGEIAGRQAARYISHERHVVEVRSSKDFISIVPHYIDCDMLADDTVFFFNPGLMREEATVRVLVSGTEVFAEKFDALCPNQSQRIVVNFGNTLTPESTIEFRLE